MHLYPSFEKALANIVGHLAQGGLVFFDVNEGDDAFFESDGVTYIREYTRQALWEILNRLH